LTEHLDCNLNGNKRIKRSEVEVLCTKALFGYLPANSGGEGRKIASRYDTEEPTSGIEPEI
jgi:hypothetical protein